MEKTDMIIDVSQNTLVCGDNLDWLKWIPDESVDLCYIDPPFFSNRNYEIIWGNGCEVRSFGDRFAGGVQHYIEWMRERVRIIHQKLKPTGALFLHCDWHASHRLRVMLDDIFDEANFLAEIVWKRTGAHGSSSTLGNIHDTIMFYRNSPRFSANKVTVPYGNNYVDKRFSYQDESGRRFASVPLTGAGPGPVRRFGSKVLAPPAGRHWTYDQAGIDRIMQEDRVHWTKGAIPRLKKYLDETEGRALQTLWDDIAVINSQSKERLGYPTQKPIQLVKRIIELASKPNEVVLDCFAGGGTTAAACVELQRRFIVGDVSPVAVRMIAERLNRACFQVPFEIKNLAKTEDGFKEMDGHKFAELICDLNGWAVNSRKSGDGGIDGWDGEGNPIQVKNHANTAAGRPDIQKFHSAIVSAKKKRGVFVAWDFARTAREYMAEIKREHDIDIVAKPCQDILGPLVLPPEKQAEIEKLYKERMPPDWEEKTPALQIPRAS